MHRTFNDVVMSNLSGPGRLIALKYYQWKLKQDTLQLMEQAEQLYSNLENMITAIEFMQTSDAVS